jgi:hypothetical protein
MSSPKPENHERLLKANPGYLETIDWYTANGYKDFNKRMRNDEKLTETQQEHLNVLDEIFRKITPITKPIIVYKGVSNDKYESDKSFISTSRNMKQTYEFTSGNCCVVVITVSPGSKVLYLEKISNFEDEQEVLLNRGGKFFITGSEKNFPKSEIFATYIPDCSVGVREVKYIKKAIDIKVMTEQIKSFFSKDEFELFEKADFETDIRYYYNKLTNEEPSHEMVELIYSKIIGE